MAIRAFTVSISSSHLPTLVAGGGGGVLTKARVSARSRVIQLLSVIGSPLPLLQPLLRSHFSNQSHIQVIRSQTMGDTSGTVPSIVVYVTVPNKEEGRKLAQSLINEKLAACVNRVPGIESTYWWQGKVETDQEELLIIKTRQSLLEALTVHVKANHPYEVPEVISLPITGGNHEYLKWLKENTKE